MVMLRRELAPQECCTLWEMQWAHEAAEAAAAAAEEPATVAGMAAAAISYGGRAASAVSSASLAEELQKASLALAGPAGVGTQVIGEALARGRLHATTPTQSRARGGAGRPPHTPPAPLKRHPTRRRAPQESQATVAGFTDTRMQAEAGTQG